MQRNQERRGSFLGRDRELGRLTALWDSARSGRGAIVLISGPAGIGKSRLAEELADRVTDAGATVAWGRSWEGGDAPRYWPWRQVLHALGQDDAAATDPRTDPFQLAESILGIVRSGDRPVVLVFDDLHAADEGTLQVLRLVSQQADSDPVLIMGTYRESDVEAGSATARSLLGIGRLGDTISLAGLEADDIATLFEQAAGLPPPPSLLPAVEKASGGNPFLVAEVARQATTPEGILRPDRSVGFRVPKGARELLGQRLNAIPTETQELLELASVIGYEFEVSLLNEVAASDVDEVERTLSPATRAELVIEKSGLGRYAFAHPLLRDLVYEGMDAIERARTHARVARVLEKRSGERSTLGELADHYFKAGAQGDLERALGVASGAGRAALEVGENDAAARHLHRALRIAEILDRDDDTRRELRGALAVADRAISETVSEVPVSGSNSFRREGEYWTITYAGTTSRLKDSKGMRYLGELLKEPGREFLALELAGARQAAPPARTEGLMPDTGHAGDILDPEAKADYRRRLTELQEEIDEAEEFNDPERAARAKEEMQFITKELAAGVGLGGRSRKASSATDRARMSVTRAMRTAIDRISESDPVLGRHLNATIKTGTYVSYTPDPAAPPNWKV